jgi:aerobic-type carbon monoxide dehydrogenase small subunit (CoxS/CutS family)
MAAAALLAATRRRTDADIDQAMAGHSCRGPPCRRRRSRRG